jgi:hypothetical protein
MKTLLHNKVKFLILVLLALSLSGYSTPDVRSKSVVKSSKSEYRNMKKGCKSFSTQDFKASYKHKKFQKKVNRSNR